MGERSAIEWTDASWTPIRARIRDILDTWKVGWHCEHASPGCEHCYSEGLNKRLGTGLPFKPGHRGDIDLFLDEKMLTAPLRWRRPRMIFVCSMTDLFADFVPDEWIDRVFTVMALCPQHTFQVLTKRSARMRAYITQLHDEPLRETQRRLVAGWPGRTPVPEDGIVIPLPNVWLGVSAEDQRRADERVHDLLATPAAVRFVSAEPLLSGIDFLTIRVGMHDAYPFPGTLDALRGILLPSEALMDVGVEPRLGPCLNWVIVGGESGQNARPMNPQWARDIRDQCGAAKVPYFHKQNGEFASVSEVAGPGAHHTFPDHRTVRRVGKARAGRLLDGVEHDGMPGVRR